MRQLTDSTRELLVHMVSGTRRSFTVRELADKAGCSMARARQALLTLSSRGLVSRRISRANVKGRPAYRYTGKWEGVFYLNTTERPRIT